MTLEEQDATLGRINREYKEAKARMVALQYKVHGLGDLLENLGRKLKYHQPQLEPFTARNFPQINQAEILASLEEMTVTAERLTLLRQHLIDAGLTPAD